MITRKPSNLSLLLHAMCAHLLCWYKKGRKHWHTIVGRHLIKVTIALGSLSLIEQWHDEMEVVLLQPLLEGQTQLLCQHWLPLPLLRHVDVTKVENGNQLL